MPARNDPRGLVTILANPECPHCVHATDAVTDWCAEIGVPVAAIDLAHHPEAARPWRLTQSPSLVVESSHGTTLHEGMPTHEEFLRLADSAR